MRKSTHTGEYALLRERLAAMRHKAGLSQRDLAQRLRVPHTWVAKVESGERRIDLIECGWFLTSCGVDPFPVLKQVMRQLTTSPRRRSSKGER
jgi:transcriptional regulator with XRE-family HTH domain